MRRDVLDLRQFYAGPLGNAAREMVARKVAEAWGGLAGLDLLALGYAWWAPGQLETEIQDNGWLHCSADPDLIFGPDIGHKYDRALKKLGIHVGMLSSEAGHT